MTRTATCAISGVGALPTFAVYAVCAYFGGTKCGTPSELSIFHTTLHFDTGPKIALPRHKTVGGHIVISPYDYVLIVEDEACLQALLVRWLRSWNYKVVAVATADDALAIMTTTPATTVIADFHLPGEHNGLWLLEQIHRRWPETRVIFESGEHTDEVMQEAFARGAIAFLPKPFARERLQGALQRSAPISRAG